MVGVLEMKKRISWERLISVKFQTTFNHISTKTSYLKNNYVYVSSDVKLRITKHEFILLIWFHPLETFSPTFFKVSHFSVFVTKHRGIYLLADSRMKVFKVGQIYQSKNYFKPTAMQCKVILCIIIQWFDHYNYSYKAALFGCSSKDKVHLCDPAVKL